MDVVIDQRAADLLNEGLTFAAAEAATVTMDEGAPGLTLSLAKGEVGEPGYNFAEPEKNQNIIAVPETWDFDSNAIAVTLVTIDSRNHEILDADVLFNTASRKFKALPSGEAPTSPFDDIQNTLTHELGHALGLAHATDDINAVMYPMAHRGEIIKRKLSPDDQSALDVLYPARAADTDTNGGGEVGCSASGRGGAGWLGLFAVGALCCARRRARLTLAAAALAPAMALSAPRDRLEAPVRDSAIVATATVLSSRTLPPGTNAQVLVTELTLEVRSCAKGPCSEQLVVRVPGGKWGAIEQWVDGLSVPAEGELVGVALQRRAEQRGSVYRLGEARDFNAFARGLAQAGVPLRLAAPTVGGAP